MVCPDPQSVCLAGEHMCTSLHKALKMSRKIPSSISSWFWRKTKRLKYPGKLPSSTPASPLEVCATIGNDDIKDVPMWWPRCFPEHLPSILLFDHTMKTRDSYLGSSQLGTRLGPPPSPTVVIFSHREGRAITTSLTVARGSLPFCLQPLNYWDKTRA